MKRFSRYRSYLFILLFLLLGGVFLHITTHPITRTSYRKHLLKEMNQTDDFTTFTDLLFRYNTTCDSISTAYTLQNPGNYNIPSLEPLLSSFCMSNYQKKDNDICNQKEMDSLTQKLTTFANTTRSQQEKFTYLLLSKYYSQQQQLANYPFYEELLGPTSGVQSNLPITLSEYPLHTKNDVKTYLALLTQIPEYFDNVIAYEEARSNLLSQTPDFILQDTQKNLISFVDDLKNNQNCFIQTFQERIGKIKSLSPREQERFTKQNAEYIKKYVLPAFSKLLSYVDQTLLNSNQQNRNSSTSNLSQSSSRNKKELPDINIPYGLSSFSNGKNYYKLLASINTGSDKSPAEMITQTESLLKSTLERVKKIALENPDIYLYYCDHPATSYLQTPESILDSLALQIRKDYPELPKTPVYEIKTVPQSLSSQLSPAFYMIPNIDNDQENTIYINPLYTNIQKGTLFTTLAHEGFPGHLYQTLYFNSTHPTLIRHTLDYPGYVEGWATYVELNSFPYMNLPNASPELIELYKADTIISLALSSRMDLGVNYENWTLSDANNFFQKLGFNTYYTADLYAYVVESPATYLRYFIGYLEIEELKTDYQNLKLNHFTPKEFHQQLLTLGPADFKTLRSFLINKH